MKKDQFIIQIKKKKKENEEQKKKKGKRKKYFKVNFNHQLIKI